MVDSDEVAKLRAQVTKLAAVLERVYESLPASTFRNSRALIDTALREVRED